MKTLVVALAMTSGALLGCSQEITASDLPSLVQNAVKAKFPAATNLEWEKKGENYEAEFEIAQVDYNALVDGAGNILSVKQELLVTDLPQPIVVALEREHQGAKIDDVEKVEKNGQVYYQVEIEKTFKDTKKVYEANGNPASITYWD